MRTIFFENWRHFQGFKMKFEIQFQFSSRLKTSSFKIRVNKTVSYEDEAFWILGFFGDYGSWMEWKNLEYYYLHLG